MSVAFYCLKKLVCRSDSLEDVVCILRKGRPVSFKLIRKLEETLFTPVFSTENRLEKRVKLGQIPGLFSCVAGSSRSLCAMLFFYEGRD